MFVAPLKFETGHLYLSLEGNEWMFDTGSPNSFGSIESLTLDGEDFKVPTAYMGMDAEQLAASTGHPTCGLLGADTINAFDVLIDIEKQEITFSKEELTFEGASLALDAFMGIPLLDAEIGGESYRMFFDTGAQVSYFQHRSLQSFPPGRIADRFLSRLRRVQNRDPSNRGSSGRPDDDPSLWWFTQNAGCGFDAGGSEGHHRQ